MSVNSESGEYNENQTDVGMFPEEDKVKSEIVFVLQDETMSDDIEQRPTEPHHGQNGDQGPSEREKPKPKPAYKRVELCIMDKVRVIAAGSTGLSQRQIAKQFGISKTQVQTLLKRKEEIMRCYNEGHQGWRKRANTKFRRHSFEDINELVSKWYSEQTNKGEITGPMLKEKAMEISVELGLGEEFKASNGWLECLKRRYDIQTVSRKNGRDPTNESATMVPMKRNQDQSGQECETENDCSRKRNKEPTGERAIGVSQEEVNEPRLEEGEPTIHAVFSMQPPRPVIRTMHPEPVVHSVHPVLLPSTHIYQRQPTPVSNTQNIRQAYPYQPLANNLETLAEIVGQEATIRMQIKSYSEALRFANALKTFAVDMGSVTLIGLMTAMEHELQREKRNSSLENDRDQQATQGANEAGKTLT